MLTYRYSNFMLDSDRQGCGTWKRLRRQRAKCTNTGKDGIVQGARTVSIER